MKMGLAFGDVNNQDPLFIYKSYIKYLFATRVD